jgi:hypothetical protein
LFFINSFLSSKFIEEFVLDEAESQRQIKDLATKPVQMGLSADCLFRMCRLRFSDRGDRKTLNLTLAQEIENWQNKVIQYRKEVNINEINRFCQKVI